jgi:hypothetical protein
MNGFGDNPLLIHISLHFSRVPFREDDAPVTSVTKRQWPLCGQGAPLSFVLDVCFKNRRGSHYRSSGLRCFSVALFVVIPKLARCMMTADPDAVIEAFRKNEAH